MKVRVTGIVLKDSSILLLKQNVEDIRNWSLPGGTLEEGETLEDALTREMREETGLEVSVGELLYICDNIRGDRHVLHITFLVTERGGVLGDVIQGKDTNDIKEVIYKPINELETYGFSTKFKEVVSNKFPGKGSYMGSKSNIGL